MPLRDSVEPNTTYRADLHINTLTVTPENAKDQAYMTWSVFL